MRSKGDVETSKAAMSRWSPHRKRCTRAVSCARTFARTFSLSSGRHSVQPSVRTTEAPLMAALRPPIPVPEPSSSCAREGTHCELCGRRCACHQHGGVGAWAGTWVWASQRISVCLCVWSASPRALSRRPAAPSAWQALVRCPTRAHPSRLRWRSPQPQTRRAGARRRLRARRQRPCSRESPRERRASKSGGNAHRQDSGVAVRSGNGHLRHTLCDRPDFSLLPAELWAVSGLCGRCASSKITHTRRP